MQNKLIREITPLTHSDCFIVSTRVKSRFDFPLHYHEEYELNLIQGAAGAKRVVGDHMEEIGDLELVLVGPNLQHGWFNGECQGQQIKESTVQFHRDFFDEKFLRRNQMSYIRNMLERSQRGISFSEKTIEVIKPRLLGLQKKNDFDSVLELLSILHDLSISRNMRLLSDASFNNTKAYSYNSRRIKKVMEYLNGNFDKNISLTEMAKLTSMTEVSFSRFFKARTGKTFVDTLNDIRLGHATRMLIDTTHGITEIAYKCGFNNISNFNRVFKKKKSCTPKEYRNSYNVSSGEFTFI